MNGLVDSLIMLDSSHNVLSSLCLLLTLKVRVVYPRYLDVVFYHVLAVAYGLDPQDLDPLEKLQQSQLDGLSSLLRWVRAV